MESRSRFQIVFEDSDDEKKRASDSESESDSESSESSESSYHSSESEMDFDSDEEPEELSPFETLNKDVLSHIASFLRYQDLYSFRRVSKAALKGYKIYIRTLTKGRSLKAGVSTLHIHQLNIIEDVMNTFETEDKAYINTYMSSGKTLMGLEIAEKTLKKNKDGSVLILVPPETIGVWISESAKHYPDKVGKLIKNRTILFDHSQRMGDRNRIRSKDFDKKQIIIVSTPTHMYTRILENITLVIFDEAHRMVDSYAEVDKKTTCKKLFMSAKTDKVESLLVKGARRITVEKQIVRFPNKTIEFVRSNDINNEVTRHFIRNGYKSGVVVYQCSEISVQAYDTQHLPQTIANSPVCYDYFKRGKTKLKKFETKGGLLLSTAKTVSVGSNFNTAQVLYICIMNGYYYAFSTEGYRQIIGRIYRESNINDNVKIVVIYDSPDSELMKVRAAWLSETAVVPIDHSTNNICTYLKTQNIDLMDLEDHEVLSIFAKEISEEEEERNALLREIKKEIQQRKKEQVENYLNDSNHTPCEESGIMYDLFYVYGLSSEEIVEILSRKEIREAIEQIGKGIKIGKLNSTQYDLCRSF